MPDLHSAAITRIRASLIVVGAELEALRQDAYGASEHDQIGDIDRHITAALALLREFERRAGPKG